MNASLFPSPELAKTAEHEDVREDVGTLRLVGGWNPEAFAQDQIRGLVRRVFFSTAARPVRQVVFSAVEHEADVRGICRRVGEALAQETTGSIAVVGEGWQVLQREEYGDLPEKRIGTPLRRIGTRARGNLWFVPALGKNAGDGKMTSVHSYLGEVRREFEYSIVEAPSAGESNEVTAMAQFADGIILVLSANKTRRATARKIKETLETAQARLLGTVLSDRVFPIPDAIYRRL
jgi:hypothetical protein